MFEKNEAVLYGTHGVCQVIGKEEQSFAGSCRPYYVLKPVYEQASVVYVPADNPGLVSRMRRLESREEILALLRSSAGDEPGWIEDDNRRHTVYRETLQSGERQRLFQMIRELLSHQKLQQSKGRRLHLPDEQLLREAQKLVEDEIAYVFELRREDVVPFIQKQLL